MNRQLPTAMSDLFAPFALDDYRFLVELLASGFNRSDDAGLHAAFDRYAEAPTDAHRAALDERLERVLGYLGAHDAAYALREATGQRPGVGVNTVIAEAARALGMHAPEHGTPRERCERVVETHTLRTWRELPRDEQQRLLEDLGVERQRALDFVKTASGVYAFPVLIGAFNAIVVQGLIKMVIFGTITKIVGARISALLFGQLLARMPWWAAWLGPASLALSAGWTALELGGPALRKTVPAVLYIGLVSLRSTHVPAEHAPLRLSAPAPSSGEPRGNDAGLHGPFDVRGHRAGAWFLVEDAAGRLALDVYLSSGASAFSWLLPLDEAEAELVRRGGDDACDALAENVQAQQDRYAARRATGRVLDEEAEAIARWHQADEAG